MAESENLTPQKYLDITGSARFIAMAWKDDALCLRMVAEDRADPIEWFPESQGRSGKHVPDKVRVICDQCPVRLECLCLALYSGEKNGIWGGRPSVQIQKMRRTLKRLLR